MEAKVTACVIGQNPRNVTANTIGDLKRKLGLEAYTASVNGTPREDGYQLSDYQYVSLAPAVKGGVN